MTETTNYILSAGRGFIEGAGIDMLMYATAQKVPALAQPSPLKLPFYDKMGIHYDDLIALGISAVIAIYGLTKKKYDLALEGAGMIVGNVVASRFQP